MLGVLEIILGHHAVAGGLRIARQNQILFRDDLGIAADLHIRAVAFVAALQRVLVTAVVVVAVAVARTASTAVMLLSHLISSVTVIVGSLPKVWCRSQFCPSGRGSRPAHRRLSRPCLGSMAARRLRRPHPMVLIGCSFTAHTADAACIWSRRIVLLLVNRPARGLLPTRGSEPIADCQGIFSRI